MRDEKLILVKLNKDQITRAKEVNGKRKTITHAVLCGSYGQLFGTEKFCRKYFSAWSKIYPDIFHQYYETDDIEIIDFQSISDLSTKLAERQSLNDRAVIDAMFGKMKQKKSKPFWTRWF